jgi:isopentenyl-diphosphate Delta-isomerase
MPLDNASELFYHVDDRDNVIGQVTRGEAHQNPAIKHRSVFILVFNQVGDLLLQKRSANKDTFPEFWTLSSSGHVNYGQSYDEAAARELEEELGLLLDLTAQKKIYLPEEREFCWIYKAFLPDDRLINFDQTEISEVQFVPSAELTEFARDHQLTPAAKRVLKAVVN